MEEKEMKFEAGKNTHENVIFACFGGLSNTGITAALASMEAVKELGLEKVAIGCLGGLPTNVGPVFGKSKAAKKIVTVDGCPFECSKKIVEKTGFKVAKSIVLVRDIGMIKKALHEDIAPKTVKPLMDYIYDEEIRRAKELIVKAIKDK
ncbi:MAG: putative zinc-binding protein [Candidatus Jordarchaeum sp.]|uniref:putative zinc-binding protein n=1 Tax=Candidatus Jordarchaeum sp. TaxID=2823881 RepID=UPI00404A083C